MMMTKKDFFLTQEGLDKLKTELDDLVTNQRHRIAVRLKEAKELGDLSENADWDAAKDHQAFIEGRISEFEHKIKNAKLIEAQKGGGLVSLGSTVHLELEDGNQRYTIVGSTEANPENGMISNESPIGKALIGKKAGEEVEVNVPSGQMVYKILKVE